MRCVYPNCSSDATGLTVTTAKERPRSKGEVSWPFLSARAPAKVKMVGDFCKPHRPKGAVVVKRY